jgi:cobalamin biosynthesis protein CobD/CbiB
MLTGLVVVLSLFATSPGTEVAYNTGWEILTTLIAPAIVPIVFMGLLLEMLMTRIWISGAQGAERRRLKGILIFETLLAIAMLVAWLPFFLSIGKGP